MGVRFAPLARFVVALGLASTVSVGLLVISWIANHSISHAYFIWNLCLAWVPFGLVLWLKQLLRRKPWSSWEGLAVTAAWLAFLPNSFYMMSDFIHLADVSSGQLLFSDVVFSGFIYVGVILGFTSLYVVHLELRRRLSQRTAVVIIGLLLLLSSLAIYIGRDLRWNTWDILLDPAGMVFDLSMRLLHPVQYPQLLTVTLPFFVLLVSLYTVVWQAMRLFRQSNG